MTIIFPMAGLSSRFTKFGFTQPKYMLKIKENSVFFNAVNSFNKYYKSCKFLFIYREILETKDFIVKECEKLHLSNYVLVELEKPTLGQAHTVSLGLENANIPQDESILIFNIDTFRPNFKLPATLDYEKIDGYLEVFQGDGEQWSFILPGDSNKVIKTTEKERISSLCSSGLYYFKKACDFLEAFNTSLANNITNKGEYYIAPLYNSLIHKGKDIRYFEIPRNAIIFCGTPEDYLILNNKENKNG
ncbi:glycosyltransferase family 2 protein [Helicobacter turcicus]|uniref:Glycosyltransferase family 2 protein n=1 Tax=Helicobacter turcicus TaxID=2867412 RepID=A0ABS7JMI7_9HELI|nr:glycosyltransferase family 2 protein [Helicobacter turcicus]MBX7490602.1 glycosyltransferase family 2 protein [Helicobacter turcicus]MBX7545489.1 glycosyltransferase family 2 protein [Helicobacter turcicus]